MKILTIALLAVGFVAACTFSLTKKDEKEEARTACVAACTALKDQGIDLSRGPCLSDATMPKGWVCDVAHATRIDVDDIPANQCAAYRLGSATHFVEVSEDCEVITTR